MKKGSTRDTAEAPDRGDGEGDPPGWMKAVASSIGLAGILVIFAVLASAGVLAAGVAFDVGPAQDIGGASSAPGGGTPSPTPNGDETATPDGTTVEWEETIVKEADMDAGRAFPLVRLEATVTFSSDTQWVKFHKNINEEVLANVSREGGVEQTVVLYGEGSGRDPVDAGSPDQINVEFSNDERPSQKLERTYLIGNKTIMNDDGEIKEKYNYSSG
jgi:hypothetical protein